MTAVPWCLRLVGMTTAPTVPAEKRTLTVPQACEQLGISRDLGYELARKGEFPATTLRLGRRLVVIAAALDRLLEGEVVDGR